MNNHVYRGFKITNKPYSSLNHGHCWTIYWEGTTNTLNFADTLDEAKEIIDTYISRNSEKLLSVYHTSKGVIVDIRDESGKYEHVFDTPAAMLDFLDTLKFTPILTDYELNVSSEFWALVINHLGRG